MIRPTFSRAINRPRLVFGIEKWTFLFAFTTMIGMIFLLQERFGFWISLGVGMALASGICKIGNLYTKRDPHFFNTRLRTMFHPATYDPALFKRFLVEIKR